MMMNCFRLRIFAPVNRRIVHYLRKCIVVRANTSRRSVYSSKSQLQDCHDHKWFTAEEVGGLSRRDLQRWCKKLGIRANTKTVQLRADLLEFHRDVLSSSSVLKYPFLPVQIPSKQLQGGSSPVTTLRHDKGPFVYRNADATQSNYWANTNVCSTHGVRHYNKKCDPDEILHEVDSDGTAINFADKRLPSVSGILRATAPKSRLFVISRWTKKQKELLGEEVFQQRMKEVREKGLEFHQFIHRCLVDRKLNSEGPARLQGFLESTKETFGRLGDAVVSEKSVSHPYLGYKGRVDTVACYDGNPCIIEWKTSKKKKSCLINCGDYPLQVVAYAGAVNSDSIFGFQVKHGLIVVAYEDGSPADVHRMDLQLCRSVWQDWLVRLFKFQNQALKAEDKHEK